jgi:dihydrofolate reductase
MTRIVTYTSVTLDGVMQAPARPDEDTRGGFRHGGWAVPYADEDLGRISAEGMGSTGGLLLGRRTYEDFYRVWPKRSDNPYTEVLNNTRKYVASRTLTEPLPWQNSTLLDGDAVTTVAKLREQPGRDIVVLGSGELVRALMAANIVDELVLVIHPLVLGAGQRLFPNDGRQSPLQLVETRTTSKGVVVASYRMAAEST